MSKVPGKKMMLGGEEYTLAPLPLGFIEDHQDEFNKSEAKPSFVIDALTASLKRNYPDITREKVRDELLDISNMQEAFLTIASTSGLEKDKEGEVGEAIGVEASPGLTSTPT